MYARKRRRRAGQGGQARDVLSRCWPSATTATAAVAELAAAVGRALGLDAEELDVLVRAAELHDVGKVAVPDEILDKPGPLDAAEWAILRQHPVAGERILGVRGACARWRGSSAPRTSAGTARGYPDGLAGEAIPLGGAHRRRLRGEPPRNAAAAPATRARSAASSSSRHQP